MISADATPIKGLLSRPITLSLSQLQSSGTAREHVIVVARKGSEVIYWEDVEEGFNLSNVSDTGEISNQLRSR